MKAQTDEVKLLQSEILAAMRHPSRVVHLALLLEASRRADRKVTVDELRLALRRRLRDNGKPWATWTITALDIDAVLDEIESA